jgi:hypothetical protein
MPSIPEAPGTNNLEPFIYALGGEADTGNFGGLSAGRG